LFIYQVSDEVQMIHDAIGRVFEVHFGPQNLN
jgi:hypothetical protein